MADTTKHKLYCYVDESGQDTLGRLFIVAIVITDERQRELEKYLEKLEVATGKKTKWNKSRDKVRQAYMIALLETDFPGMIFAKKSSPSETKYDESEVLATAQAISMYRENQDIGENDFKVTITIDGLSKTTAARMAPEFRKLGIKTRKLVGKKDESSAIIRLADAIAGLVRESHEGRPEYQVLERKLRRSKKLNDL